MKDINIEDLKVAQRRASKDSIRVTKALGLPYYTDINKFKEDERYKSFLEKKLFIENNILVCQETINSYEAALVATFFREELLKKLYFQISTSKMRSSQTIAE